MATPFKRICIRAARSRIRTSHQPSQWQAVRSVSCTASRQAASTEAQDDAFLDGLAQRPGVTYTSTEEQEDLSKVDESNMSALAHRELQQHRELREMVRLAAWEMPLLSQYSTPFQPPANGLDSANGAVKHHSELDDLLMDIDTGSNDSIAVNVALASAPTPSLGITFPMSSGSDVVNIIVEVQPNADIKVIDRESIFRNDESAKTEDMRQREHRLAKAFDACSDLGVWVEWVRTQSSP